MIVNLGSIEVDDEMRKIIRRALHNLSGCATRMECKAYFAQLIAEEIAGAKEMVSVASSAAVVDIEEFDVEDEAACL